MSHPSFLALDRHALGVVDAAIEAHADECDACRAHLMLVLQPVPVIVMPVKRRVWAWALPAIALGALCVWAMSDRDDTVTAKGAPSVGVYVKRGDDVFLWNGSAPLRADDRLRLRIRAAGYRQVQVSDGAGNVLYAGPLAGPETTLPLSWRIEPPEQDETLIIVLSDSPNHPLSYRVELRLPVEEDER